MRSTLIKIMVAAMALTLIAPLASATKKKEKKVTLPNGKVLINPYVISNNAYSLEVGHNNGITKILLKDCPEKIQKKYGYSPEKAAAYKKQQAKKKEALKKKKAEEARKKKIKDEQFLRYRRDASIENMEIEVKKIENRIAFLKKEIPKLEASNKNMLDKTSDMASTSVAGDSGGNRSEYSWYGGYTYSSNSNRAGNRAERTKERQISKLDDEYATNKHRLKTYQKELSQKEIDLLKLNQRLKKAKQQKATQPPLPKK